MIRLIRTNLEAMLTRPVRRGFNAMRIVPEGVLVAGFRRFLRRPAAASLGTTDPAASAELERMAEQIRTNAGIR